MSSVKTEKGRSESASDVSSSPDPGNPRSGSGTETGSETFIGGDLEIVGEFRSNQKLNLRGKIEGEVYCASLIVNEEGRVTGKIVADEVVIHGFVKGNIYAKSVDIFSSSDVSGDIFHRGIGIEKGTKYEGTLKYLEDPIAAGEKAEG